MNNDKMLVPVIDDMLIVELDDRLEFSHVMPMGDICGNNGVCNCNICPNVACDVPCGG
jgi:hypothetical protein